MGEKRIIYQYDVPIYDFFYDPTYRAEVIEEMVLFKPDFVIFSAGFDAHDEDPLADVELTEKDFIWATEIGDSHNIFDDVDGGRGNLCV